MEKENPQYAYEIPIIDTITSQTSPEDLVIVGDWAGPAILYYAERKGWVVYPEHFTKEYFLEKKEEGVNTLLITYEYLRSNKLQDTLYEVIPKDAITVEDNEQFISFTL